jgi:mono/diheme cytochrome c family protein
VAYIGAMSDRIFAGERRGRRRSIILLAALLLVESAYLAYPWASDLVFQREESDAARGRRLAGELGCFNCHGPGGRGGVPNPGSKWDSVPSFHEGTPMMFVANDADIRAYILDGAPGAKRQRESYQKEIAAQAIRMPAYRGWIAERDVDALVAYVRAASELLAPEGEEVLRGGEIARTSGCFGCHGAMGSGGLSNPGSFKGYIPGFQERDFEELVRSDEELRAWIAKGAIPRLRDDPFASFFLERQRIQMPAYEKFLSEADINAVAAYVRWLAQGSWRQLALGHK